MDDNFTIAKTVIISSFLTLVILCGLLFVFRESVVSYITDNIESPPPALVETMSEPIVDAVDKVNPSVVSVVVTKDVPIYERYYEQLTPWGGFGGISIPRLRETGIEEREVGGGTGFIVSGDGLIVTNRHVVADQSARYSVILSTGEIYEVEVAAVDPEIDIAILNISEELTEPLPAVSFGNSDTVRVGQTVIAIGNALAEFQNSVSVGVISGLSRTIVATDSKGLTEQLQRVIQTDAAINPGNSGGPLLNLSGEVIGVNVATSRGADNISFAIPSQMVKYTVDSVLQHGELVKPFLGVRYTTMTPRMAVLSNAPVEYGAVVVSGSAGEPGVLPGSPAELAGIQEGDIIVAVDGASLEIADLSMLLRGMPVDVPVAVEIVRGETYHVLEVVLAKDTNVRSVGDSF